MEIESARKTGKLRQQALRDLAADKDTIRTKASRLRNFHETLGRGRRDGVTITSDVRDLAVHSKNIHVIVKTWTQGGHEISR